jgi:putative membrane protein insertion efficiency factor
MTLVTGTPVAAPPHGLAAEPAGPPTGAVARLLVAIFRMYQLVRVGRVSPCRFTPTCSHYAVEAVSRHGAHHGLALTIRRLGRCRPGGPSGFDPVPDYPSSRTRDL